MNNVYKDPNPNYNPDYVRQYQLFDNVLKTREALIKGNFWDQAIIDRFVELFKQFIDIIAAEFDPLSYVINIKIRKTTVKKMPNYRAESIFYYNAIGNAMMILLKENKERAIDCLANYFHCNTVDAYDLYFKLTTDSSYLYNLANVQCISDSIIQIIL